VTQGNNGSIPHWPNEGAEPHWGQTVWVALVCTTGKEPEDPGYRRQPLTLNDQECEPYGDWALTNRVQLTFGPFTQRHTVAYAALMENEQGPEGFRVVRINQLRQFQPLDTAVLLRGSIVIPSGDLEPPLNP
jgi:hypothetical protein